MLCKAPEGPSEVWTGPDPGPRTHVFLLFLQTTSKVAIPCTTQLRAFTWKIYFLRDFI